VLHLAQGNRADAGVTLRSSYANLRPTPASSILIDAPSILFVATQATPNRGTAE